MIAAVRAPRGRREWLRTGGAVVAGAIGAGVVLLGPPMTELGPTLADRAILVLAVISMAVALGLAILRPWLGLLAWIVLMPVLNVARVRIETTPAAITATTLVLVALVVGSLLEGRDPIRAARPTVLRLAWLLAAVLVGVTVASTVVHGQPLTSWPIALHGVVEPVLAVLIVLESRPDTRRLWQLAGALVTSAAMAAAYSIYRLARTAAFSGIDQVVRGDFGHYVYYNVNIFGEILGMTVPLAIGFFLLTRSRARLRIVAFAASALLAVALYFTFSKGAWLGGLCGATLVVGLAVRRARERATTLVAAALVALLIVPVPLYLGVWLAGPTAPTTPGATPAPSPSAGAYQQLLGLIQGQDRLSSWDPASSSGEVSVHERYLAWRAAVEMAASSPLVGVGPGRFETEVVGPFRQRGSTRPLSSAHNYILNIAAELGVVAAAVVSLAMLAAAWLTFRTWRWGAGSTRILGLAVGGGLLAFLVIGETTGADLYEAYRVMNSDAMFVALLVAIALGLGQLRAVSETGPTSAT